MARTIATVDLVVRDGGIITLPGLPLERQLVGYFEWISDHTAFVFPAFGDTNADGRLIAFTHLNPSGAGVCFIHDTLITAYLCAIEKAALEDPDDYRVAWSLWQEVLPRQRRLIERARDAATTACDARSKFNLPLTESDAAGAALLRR